MHNYCIVGYIAYKEYDVRLSVEIDGQSYGYIELANPPDDLSKLDKLLDIDLVVEDVGYGQQIVTFNNMEIATYYGCDFQLLPDWENILEKA